MNTGISLQCVRGIRAEDLLTKAVLILHYLSHEVKSCTYQGFDMDCGLLGLMLSSNNCVLISYSNNKFAEEAKKVCTVREATSTERWSRVTCHTGTEGTYRCSSTHTQPPR
jgi:hypothetical protein